MKKLDIQINSCTNDIISILEQVKAGFERPVIVQKVRSIMMAGIYDARDLSMVIYGAIEWTGGAYDLYCKIKQLPSIIDYYEEYPSSHI